MKLLLELLAWPTLLAAAVARFSLLIWSNACGSSGRTVFSSISCRWLSLAWRCAPWMKLSTDRRSLAWRMSQMSRSTIRTSSAFSMSSLAQSRTMLATTKMLGAGISVKSASSFSASRTSSSVSTWSQPGLTSRHRCLCRKLTASHSGTDTGSPGLKGPTSPHTQHLFCIPRLDWHFAFVWSNMRIAHGLMGIEH